MSHRLNRAQLLLQQSRHAEAEREALLALSEDPESARGHCCLALSRTELRKNDEALGSALRAVTLAPDDPYCHHIYSVVLHRLDREQEALRAIEEAIRLDPEDESHFAVLASVYLGLRDWKSALSAAEQGLALNPEDVTCANLRSMALVRLGRKSEAMQTVGFALQREPEHALSHTNQGWNCLHKNEPRAAQMHFREALRLEPDLEYARQGMLEALKARNPVYRVMLAYFLWMGRLSGRMQWVFVIGTYFISRFVGSMARSDHGLSWMTWPLVIGFYLFIYLSWTAGPMFNLLLRLDRFGRMVLSRDERVASNWFGIWVVFAAAALVFWALGNPVGSYAAVVCAMLSVCTAVTFGFRDKKRAGFATATVVMGLIGLGALGMLMSGNESGFTWLTAFFVSFLVLQISAHVAAR